MGKQWCSSCCRMQEVATTVLGYICCTHCGKVLAEIFKEEEICYTEIADAVAGEDNSDSTNTISGNAIIEKLESDEISVLGEAVQSLRERITVLKSFMPRLLHTVSVALDPQDYTTAANFVQMGLGMHDVGTAAHKQTDTSNLTAAHKQTEILFQLEKEIKGGQSPKPEPSRAGRAVRARACVITVLKSFMPRLLHTVSVALDPQDYTTAANFVQMGLGMHDVGQEYFLQKRSVLQQASSGIFPAAHKQTEILFQLEKEIKGGQARTAGALPKPKARAEPAVPCARACVVRVGMGKEWCSSCCMRVEVATTKTGYTCCNNCGKVLAETFKEEEICYTKNADASSNTNIISGNASIEKPKSDEIALLGEAFQTLGAVDTNL
ncbi:hypothetical protein KSS87_000588 [Heliosperma pusillum]|nr:hypothetical protein KSS87_000588 [Heliosperma pusillum]